MALSKNAVKARQEFRNVYGNQTVNIVRDIASGKSTGVIATNMNVGASTVAAVKANLTRGNYAPYAVVGVHDQVFGRIFTSAR